MTDSGRMDRTTALAALAVAAMTSGCPATAALDVAREVLGDRQMVGEDELGALLEAASRAGSGIVWAHMIGEPDTRRGVAR